MSITADLNVVQIMGAARRLSDGLQTQPGLLAQFQSDPVSVLNEYGAGLPALPAEIESVIAPAAVELYNQDTVDRMTRFAMSGEENSLTCWACYAGLGAVIAAVLGAIGSVVGPAVVASAEVTGPVAAAAGVSLATVAGAAAIAAGAATLAAAVGYLIAEVCHAIPGCCSAPSAPQDTNWSKPTPIDQNTTTQHHSDGAPALAMLGDTLYCAHKGQRNDNTLWITSVTSVAGDWSADTRMRSGDPANGPTFNTLQGPALAAFSGSLYCFYNSLDQHTVSYTVSADGVHWSAPTTVPGASSSAEPAVTVFDGQWLCCVWPDAQSALQYSLTNDGSSWMAQPKPIPGCSSTSGVGLTEFSEAVYCVFRDGESSDLRYATLPGAQSTWSAHPFGADDRSSAKPSLVDYRGTLFALYRGDNDGVLWYATFDPPSQQWTSDQQVPSLPIVNGAGPSAVEIQGQLLSLYPMVLSSELFYQLKTLQNP